VNHENTKGRNDENEQPVDFGFIFVFSSFRAFVMFFERKME